MHALRLRCRFHLLGCTVFVPLSYPKHSAAPPLLHGIPCGTVSHTDTFWLRANPGQARVCEVRPRASQGRSQSPRGHRSGPRSPARAHTHMLAHGARRYPLGSSLAVFAWARGAARSAWGHVSSALGAVLTRPPETYVLLAGHAATAEVCARAHSPGGEAARGSLHEALAHCGARIRFPWLSVY